VFGALIDQGASLPQLAVAADALERAARLELLGQLTPARLKKLYALADTAGQGKAVTLDWLLAPGEVSSQWPGINSLPAFRRFTKCFARSDDDTGLAGHNAGRWSWVIGPGYFWVTPRDIAPAEFLFDYTRLPSAAHPGWPPLKDNRGFPRNLAFGNLNDLFRPVGQNLGIGATYRHGKFAGQYFALVRG